MRARLEARASASVNISKRFIAGLRGVRDACATLCARMPSQVTPLLTADRIHAASPSSPARFAAMRPTRELHFIGVLKGSVFFLADLVRALPGRMHARFHRGLELRRRHHLVGRGAHAQGRRPRPAGPRRDHRRGHRRHRPDAQLPAGHPPRPRAAQPAHGVPAVASRRAARSTCRSTTSASPSKITSSSATGSTSTSTTGTSRTSACSLPDRGAHLVGGGPRLGQHRRRIERAHDRGRASAPGR